MSTFWLKRGAETDPAGLSRRGYVYQASIDRTLAGDATASAQFTTGSVATVIYLREGVTTAESAAFRLWETTATSGVSGSVTGHNLNRTITGSGSVALGVLSASVTGASVTNLIAYDVIPGSGNKGSGIAACSKVRTLKPSSTYLMEFTNLGNNTTTIHATLVWSEREPSPYDQLV